MKNDKLNKKKLKSLQETFNYLEDIQAPVVIAEYIDNLIKQIKRG